MPLLIINSELLNLSSIAPLDPEVSCDIELSNTMAEDTIEEDERELSTGQNFRNKFLEHHDVSYCINL